MVQEEYRFDEPPKEKPSAIKGIGRFIWNSETREFCGRDGASWSKVSLFYAIFYAFLGSFFVGMLAVFVQIMPKDKPTYYGESSTMNARGLNPGLGFRPQIDVEDSLISFNPLVYESAKEKGFKPLVNNLAIFLKSKYKPYTSEDEPDLLDCSSSSGDNAADLIAGKSCRFDYEKVFANTPCTEKDNFAFETNAPCILIKLNKIISWRPQVQNSNNAIVIKCEGETSADKDNLHKVSYHSEGNVNNPDNAEISAKYFPYFAQKSYRMPFVFVQFDITPNTLVNIECKAYADNIDNKDRLNRRGMTKFTLYVKNSPK